MAIYECNYRLGFTDVGRGNLITNKGVLKILENAGGMHSNQVGYGLNQIEETKLSWVLLNWKVKIIKRPKYNDVVYVKTWARDCSKISTYRDYEIYDKDNNLLIIATSKWAMINIDTKALAKLSDELISAYQEEEKRVFNEEKIPKLIEPQNYSCKTNYKILRSQIDVNEHVHNLYYLDFATEALPDNVYKMPECNNIEIMYKKQIKFGEDIICLYSNDNNKNIVTIKSKDESILHAIVYLY